METRAHYVAVGAFVLAIVGLTFFLVIWIAGRQLTTQYSHYDIFFKEQVPGLSEGGPVTYKGVPVGKVAEIEIQRDDLSIRVTIDVKSDTIIKKDVKAEIDTNLLSGVSSINIIGGTPEAPTLVAEPGQRYPVIQPTLGALARGKTQLPEILKNIERILSSENINAIHEILAQLDETTKNLKSVTGNVASHNEDIAETITQARTTLETAAHLFRSIDKGFTDPNGLKDQLGLTLADYDRLAKGVLDTNHQLLLALQDARPGVRQFAQQTLPQVGDLIADARQFVQGLTRLASTIERDPTRFLFGDRREGYRPR